MKPIYTQKEFKEAKSLDKLACKCESCQSIFYTTKKLITHEIKHQRGRIKFCSQKCNNEINNVSKKIKTKCANCENIFERYLNQINKSKKHFCSHSCHATYVNSHKVIGTRRSKLEAYIETRLKKTYPRITIDFNKKDAINSELDIYIPSLKLAFELNGIYHYEPIYGPEKLNQIQNNDHRKFQACAEKNISLCIIDVSKQKYFKESTSIEFINIITDIINKKLLTS